MGLLVDITTRCNMTCGHCMWSRTQQGEDMTEETFRAALNMKPVRGHGTFSFGSGEPTVHPRFWDFLNIALEDKRWTVRVVTNGKLTETCVRVAELAKDGLLEGHLSLDKWHDPIDPVVVEAFKRDPKNPNDKRAYRFCEDKDLKNVGRCDFGADKRPSCRCPVPKVTPDGKVFLCGCESAVSIGHVLTGWDPKLVRDPRKLGCERFRPDANRQAPFQFFAGVQSLLRRGKDREAPKLTRREEFANIFARIEPALREFGTIEVMGSFSRGSENPKDIDVLLVCETTPDMDAIAKRIGATRWRNHKFRSSYLVQGVLIEVFPTKPESAGSARLYLEGPTERNEQLRRQARKKGLTWKFQGLFSEKGELLSSHDKNLVHEMIVKS